MANKQQVPTNAGPGGDQCVRDMYKRGTVTMSTYRLITMLAVSFCVGVSLSDLFLNHRQSNGFFFLDSPSKRLSVESIQMLNEGCNDNSNNNRIRTALGLDHAGNQQVLASPPQQQQQQQSDAAILEVMGGGAFDPGSTYTYNRTITLIHLGKTGGSTFRTATRTLCRYIRDPKNPRRNLKRVCAVNPKLPKSKVTMVGQMIQDLFHMWGYNETLLPLVSTYLMTVRHPVERLISSYRYSHPKNCLPKFHDKLKISQAGLPWGCQLIKNKKIYNPQSVAYRMYQQCFPSPGIEDFAQSMGSPWISNPHFETNLTLYEQWQCRQLARNISRGAVNHGTAPHMQYNFDYYSKKTLDRFPDKELLVVRTEHQWPDMVDIDIMLGGNGKAFKGSEEKKISHGSSSYTPSPLSREGYQKLCCILVDEVELYLQILNRAANLNPESKQESIQSFYDSCSIPNWDVWKTECRWKLLEDDSVVEKHLAGSTSISDFNKAHPSKKEEKEPPPQTATTSLTVSIHPPSPGAGPAATPSAHREKAIANMNDLNGSSSSSSNNLHGPKEDRPATLQMKKKLARRAKATVQQKR